MQHLIAWAVGLTGCVLIVVGLTRADRAAGVPQVASYQTTAVRELGSDASISGGQVLGAQALRDASRTIALGIPYRERQGRSQELAFLGADRAEAQEVEPPRIDRIVITPGRQMAFSGDGPAGGQVAVRTNGQTLGTVRVDGRGRWSLRVPRVFDAGDHRVIATVPEAQTGRTVVGQDINISIPERLSGEAVVAYERIEPRRPSAADAARAQRRAAEDLAKAANEEFTRWQDEQEALLRRRQQAARQALVPERKPEPDIGDSGRRVEGDEEGLLGWLDRAARNYQSEVVEKLARPSEVDADGSREAERDVDGRAVVIAPRVQDDPRDDPVDAAVEERRRATEELVRAREELARERERALEMTRRAREEAELAEDVRRQNAEQRDRALLVEREQAAERDRRLAEAEAERFRVEADRLEAEAEAEARRAEARAVAERRRLAELEAERAAVEAREERQRIENEALRREAEERARAERERALLERERAELAEREAREARERELAEGEARRREADLEREQQRDDAEAEREAALARRERLVRIEQRTRRIIELMDEALARRVAEARRLEDLLKERERAALEAAEQARRTAEEQQERLEREADERAEAERQRMAEEEARGLAAEREAARLAERLRDDRVLAVIERADRIAALGDRALEDLAQAQNRDALVSGLDMPVPSERPQRGDRFRDDADTAVVIDQTTTDALAGLEDLHERGEAQPLGQETAMSGRQSDWSALERRRSRAPVALWRLDPNARCRNAAGQDLLSLPGIYTVAYGDTLWDISERHYGSGVRYDRIYRANRRKIRNPHLIFPCQRFKLPRPARTSHTW